MYPIDDEVKMDINFEYDEEDGWLHLCKLQDCAAEEMLDITHGHGIDSPKI